MKNFNKFWKPASIALGTLLILAGVNAVGWRLSKSSISSEQQQFATKPMPAFPIRANRKSGIYHWRGCPNYEDIKDHNTVEFATRKEAEQAGFRPAKNC